MNIMADYRQDIDVQKTFYKHEISQAILSLFMLFVAFDVFRNMNAIMPQNRWCYYITAIVYCVGGIASVIVSFMTKKLPDAKFCVFADGRGIFNPMINYFNMLFAFFFVILIQVLGYANTSPGWFTMASVFLLYLGVYGQVYRRTHCIVVQENVLLVYGFKGIREIPYSEISGFTTSMSMGGYKTVDASGKVLFRWAMMWSRHGMLGDFLEKKGVQFFLKRNNKHRF